MADRKKQIEMQFRIYCVLEGNKCFFKGNDDKAGADSFCAEANKTAEELKIKSRYVVEENKDVKQDGV